MRPFIALAVALAILGAAVAAAAAPAMDRAVLELVINGAPRGEAFVYLREGDVLVPLQVLRDAGLVRLEVATEVHEGTPHVSLLAASPPLLFDYDERALTVTITAPPSVLARTSVDLATGAPPDMLYDYSPSLFLNYAPRLLDGRQFQTFGEAGLSLGATRVETSANYDTARGATRLNTKVTFDDRAHLRTATLGDTFTSAGPLGGALMLGGLSLGRNYDLDPYLVKIPRLGYTGSAMSPSTVDVYVNDVLVRRVPVDPGEFQLTNVTPLAGAGTTRYVLRDAYGGEQRLESTYYASAGVLAAGLSEYGYAIGMVREDFGTESFSYGEPALVGRHRFGISDHVTPGFHVEFDRSLANAGTEVTVAGEFGEIEFHTAGSIAAGASARRGYAGLAAYAYRRAGTSLRTVIRGASHDYSTLTLNPEQDRGLVEHVTTTGHALGSRANVGTDIAFALLRDAGPAARFTVTLNTRLTNALNLQIRASRSQIVQGTWEHDVFTTLTWSLPAQHMVQVTEQVGSSGNELTGRVSRPLQQPTGVGYQVSGTVGEQNRASANLQAQSSFGRVGATYTNVDGDQHTILEGSGSVVLVDRGVYFSRPTTQSFAVLEVPGAPGVRGYLNNREFGKTNRNGRLFVPDLLPYQANRLRIEQADLPMDYQLDQEEIVLAPPPRGGAVVAFPARPVRLVRGRIVRRSGGRSVPVKYGTMKITTADDVLMSPLGSNGEFEFDRLPEGHWTGSVSWEEGRCLASLQVKATESIVQDIGAVVCSGEAEAASP